jgi:hypothetical protein
MFGMNVLFYAFVVIWSAIDLKGILMIKMLLYGRIRRRVERQ